MGREMASRFQRWFEHERDAHDKVLRSLEGVPADRRSGPEFLKAVAILAHVAAARRVWLVRLGILPGQQGTLSPEQITLPEVADLLRAVQGPWVAYLGRVTDEEIGREVEYQSLDAGRFRTRVEDVLTQLVGHSSYHRGQIAMLVRAAGGEPAVTDFIYWCRESVLTVPQ